MKTWYKCEGSESRKNILDGARLNPKHYDNRQSAAKPEKESSTTIPREGSTLKLVEVGRPKQIELWDKI